MKVSKHFSSFCFFLILIIAGHIANAQNETEIPCEFINNTIYLEVKINGQGPFLMTLDTGTYPSAIDLTAASKIGLKISRAKSVGKGLGSNKISTQKTRIGELGVSGIRSKNVAFETTDLTTVNSVLKKPIIGLLGYSFLKDKIFRIDYPHHRLLFYKKPPLSNSGAVDEVKLPMIFDAHVPSIETSIGGKMTRAVIDTGGSYELLLTPQAVARLGLEKEFKESKTLSGSGYAGQQEIRLGRVGNLKIGTFIKESAETVFAAFGNQSPFKLSQAGVGTFFLQDFAVLFDYKNKQIILRK